MLGAYCAARAEFYRLLVIRNPKLAAFQKGWNNRLQALRKEVGLPTFGFSEPADPADAGPMLRIPDIGVDPEFDLLPASSSPHECSRRTTPRFAR